MNSFLRFVLVWMAIVLVFDLLASLISLFTGIPYGWFTIGSAVIYASVGFRGAPQFGLRRGVFASVLIALCEGTLGWWISWLVGPGRPDEPVAPTALLLPSIVVSAIIFGGVIGLLGGGAAIKRRPAAQ